MIRVKPEDAEFALERDELFLRGFHLLFEIVQLSLEPLRDPLGRFEAGLVAAVNVAGDDGVDDVSGQLGIGRGVADTDDVGLGNELDGERALKQADDGLTNGGIVKGGMRDNALDAKEVRIILQLHLPGDTEQERVALENGDLREHLVGARVEPGGAIDAEFV